MVTAGNLLLVLAVCLQEALASWCQRSLRAPFLIQVASKGERVLQEPVRLQLNVKGLISELPCRSTLKLNESFDLSARCPESCPYHAMDRQDNEFCTSACVTASSCAALNPNTPVPDLELGTCRGAKVDGCIRHSMDGSDSCSECASYYYRTLDGQCRANYMWAAYAGLALIALITLCLLAYLLELNLRPITNREGLEDGLAHRSKQKFRAPNADRKARCLWPLSTNLCRTAVGGPGLLLHFNFQAAVTAWAFVVGFGWLLLGLVVDEELLVLGRRSFGSGYRNCVLVAWGHATQQRLMGTKLCYVSFVYVASFLGSLLHSVRQLHRFQQIDAESSSMKSFAGLLRGLPRLKGHEASNLEEELREACVEATGNPIVGVSVCWDFGQYSSQLEQLATQEPTSEVEDSPGFLRRQLVKMERFFLVPAKANEAPSELISELLQKISSSSEAFVVFETREVRDTAVERLAGGLQFKGHRMTLEAAVHEPHGIFWQNFDSPSFLTRCCRLCKGGLCIMTGLLVWFSVFYLPYAWAILTFNYEGGREPGLIYSFCFSMIVVVGNVSMVHICSHVSDYMGFRYKDTRESCYMILYLVTISLNVGLDLITTYYMSFQIMSQLGFRTFEGIPLLQLHHFMDRFEAYAVQRSLGQNLYDYAFPSTFLVPFILEPLLTIYGLLRISILLVRSHPEMQPSVARTWLSAQPLELGRYADCLVNILLSVLIFFFPGGYTHWTFFMLSLSQAYIYAYDHWRVLRVVPAATFASMDVDWWSQALLAPCCGLLLACLVFKGNCQQSYCLDAEQLLLACLAAWGLHSALHLSLLCAIPWLAGKASPIHEVGQKTYQQVAECDPCSWFSANPVHCLRSKHLFGHSPACSFFRPGQEHRMEVNESIGCYFHEEDIEVEAPCSYELRLPQAAVFSAAKGGS
mmetsp:Transcript_52534/g.94248  ORF Transcript_52534/g.94248 Transcript_52534/m.94248 type:complete len:920 (+) Transcript_52534:73-2832(+)